MKTCLLVIGLAFSFLIAYAQGTSLDDYWREANLRGIALSPDGKKLVAIRRVTDDSYRLIVYDLEKNASILAVVDEAEEEDITGVRWFNNQRMGVRLSGVLEKRSADIPYHRALSMDANGQNVVHLLTDQKRLRDNLDLSKVVSTLPSDPEHILMMARDRYPMVYRVNINSGVSEEVAKGVTATIAFRVNNVAEGFNLVRMDFSPATRKITFRAFNNQSKKWKKVASYRPNELDDVLEKQLVNFDGKTTVSILNRRDDDEYVKLHRYDITTETFTDVVYEVDGYDVNNILPDPHTGEILGVSYIADRPHHVYFDEVNQQVQAHLEHLFPNGEVTITSISQDKSKYLFYSNEPWHPGSVGLLDRKSNHISQIANLAPQLQGARTSMHAVDYKARDDTELHGYLTRPEGTDPLPLIVFPHGGPLARDWVTFNPIVQYWAGLGYAVFQPNFRGSSGFGRSFEDAGNHQHGGAMIDDIAAGVRALVDGGVVLPDAICAAGYSYGDMPR